MRVRLFLFIISILYLFIGTREINAGSPYRPFFRGIALDGDPITGERLEQVEQEMRLHPQIVVFFLQWPSIPETTGFPLDSLNAIWKRGAVPSITWEPMYYANGKEIMVSYESILKGAYDTYLAAFAKKAKSWGKPFLIRFAHEMNIERYHWGSDKKAYGPKSPEIYKQMFRYIVSLFRREGADNALWVFCPNAESVPNTSYDPGAAWNQARSYYPGDDYIDILGMDGYNWGTTRTVEKNGWKSQWRSFKDIFQSIYGELKAISPRKPLFVFETASASMGGEKRLWVKEAFESIDQWDVQGIVWFQAKKEVDWRINSDGDMSYVSLIHSKTSCSQQWFEDFLKKSGNRNFK